MSWVHRSFICAVLLSIGICIPAHAVVINFNDQPLSPGNVLDTRTISTAGGNVTFDGGELISGFRSDHTTVYATSGGQTGEDSPFSNPLTITFQNPVSHFSVEAFGGIDCPPGLCPPQDFLLADDAFHFDGQLSQPDGFVTLALDSPTGVLTIRGPSGPGRAPGWFFAIDNVSFDAAAPLPAALPLFATGLVGLGLLGWRRKCTNAPA